MTSAQPKKPTRRTKPNVDKLAAAAVNDDVALGAIEAASLLGVSRSVWYRLIAEGKAPPPDIRINARVVRWKARTVKQCANGLKAA
ncbi:MAG: hypothetical protein V4795_13190 [Pseudomonadota bacterium]